MLDVSRSVVGKKVTCCDDSLVYATQARAQECVNGLCDVYVCGEITFLHSLSFLFFLVILSEH